MERVVEIREDILSFVAEDGMQFNSKVIDIMVDEFGERLENYEVSRNTTVKRDSKTYKRILAEAVRNVCKRTNNIEFQETVYDTIEDDYSENSDAEFRLRR